MQLPADAEIRRTHISTVFLTGDRVYKCKRPVSLGFVDYSTRALRQAACEAEIALNRRLAPDVYLGVVELDGPEEVRGEPAVEMVRLRDEDSLLARLERGEVDRGLVAAVGRVIGAFHAGAPGDDLAREAGAPERFAHHVRENFDQTADHVPATCHPDLYRRVREASLAALPTLLPTLAARSAAGRVRDGHGDLRLEHVYVDAAGAIRVIDGVEFNPAYRCGDVALDLAFLAMDLRVRSRRDLAAALIDAWVSVTGDEGARAILPPFVAYRSIVRAKVAGFTAAAEPARRAALTERARRHWSLAWGELAGPGRPALVGVGGRPGTGKSTVSRALPMPVIRTDVVRKELANVDAATALPPHDYSPAARGRVYDACFLRAEALLARGEGAVIDASFTGDAWRRRLLALGERWAVPTALLRCEAPRTVVAHRLEARTGDASDADLAVYDATPWEPESPAVAAVTTPFDSDRPPDVVAEAARSWLAGLRAG